jgi:hypothetical protein
MFLILIYYYYYFFIFYGTRCRKVLHIGYGRLAFNWIREHRG